MSWWRGQNLDLLVIGPDGTAWNFLVWMGHFRGVCLQRIYFWDEAKATCGVLDFTDSQILHIRKLKDRIKRLAKDGEYRNRYLCPLKFPIQRNWPPPDS